VEKTIIFIYIYVVELANGIKSGCNTNTKTLLSFKTISDLTHRLY